MNRSINSTKQRILPIDGVINFRDLGGYANRQGARVRWGKVYRSAQLDRPSDQGAEDLRNLGVKTVVDLRFSDESRKYPTLQNAVPGALMLSWHDEQNTPGRTAGASIQADSDKLIRGWRDSLESGDPAQVREAMRLNYPQKLYSHAAIYERMLRELIEDATPLVFHCAAGKDRTGVAAALILGLLEVDNSIIKEDYLVTQGQMASLMNSWLAGGATDAAQYEDFQSKLLQHAPELIQPVFDADPSYIDTLLDYVDVQYQGFYGYAQQKLGLSDTDLSRLQANLLED